MRSILWKEPFDKIIRRWMTIAVILALFISTGSISIAQEATPESTGGRLYELPDGDALGNFAESLLFEQWRLNAIHVGQIGGMDGELSIRMPDCLMSKARIVLLGSQQNENMTLNCEADRVYNKCII